ncbi:MAG: hypothetical protein AAB250_18855, partial [Bdellovibrionota bacterium]
SLLKVFGSASALMTLPQCAKPELEIPAKATPPVTPKNIPVVPKADGYLAILQGPTSSSEALINVLAPRLKTYIYTVVDSTGAAVQVERYEVVKGPVFYSVDKLRVTGLRIGETYTLNVHDRKTLIDQRTFGALDTTKAEPRIALASCMSDDRLFAEVIDPMGRRLQEQDIDLLVLCGDEVYVDSFEFVERQKATEFDLWQRYVDALKRIPLYHWRALKPTLAVWDDHDYGTNDGDRDFISKDQALRLFRAVFGGPSIEGVWEQSPNGCSSAFKAFGQRFYLMDDRTFRQPNKNQQAGETFGHWGQAQHEWLIERLRSDRSPAWIINGNQLFNGVSLTFKEAFEQNHAPEFVALIDQLKTIEAPVVFSSGDVHLSEIMRIPKERIGYETFEITSSSMHSFVGSGWENPMRLSGAYTREFNFVVVRSQASAGKLDLDVQSLGLAPAPYFSQRLSVERGAIV